MDRPVNTEPVDASEVVPAANQLIELCERILWDGVDGMPDQKAQLWGLLRNVAGVVRGAQTRISRDVAPDLADPVQTLDGTWVTVTQRPRFTSWDTEALQAAVTRIAVEGEPTVEEAVSRLWEFVQPATGRTGVFRKAGLDPEEFAKVDRSPMLTTTQPKPGWL